MILIDTNVISMLMTPSPEITVLNWLNKQDTTELYLSTITIAEIGYGLRIMPEGKRRQELAGRFNEFVIKGFEYRILNFNMTAAHEYAEVMGHRKTIGRPLNVHDGQIASIARVNNFSVATRNVRDFEECGINLINPFDPVD